MSTDTILRLELGGPLSAAAERQLTGLLFEHYGMFPSFPIVTADSEEGGDRAELDAIRLVLEGASAAGTPLLLESGDRDWWGHADGFMTDLRRIPDLTARSSVALNWDEEWGLYCRYQHTLHRPPPHPFRDPPVFTELPIGGQGNQIEMLIRLDEPFDPDAFAAELAASTAVLRHPIPPLQLLRS